MSTRTTSRDTSRAGFVGRLDIQFFSYISQNTSKTLYEGTVFSWIYISFLTFHDTLVKDMICRYDIQLDIQLFSYIS